jgi:hypothetical protein
MAPQRPGVTSVRRAIGVAAVSFLFGSAVVFYQGATGFPTFGSSPRATANSSARPAPTGISPKSVTPGGSSPSADPSRAADSGPPPTSTPTPGDGDSTGAGPAGEETVHLEDSVDSAKPFQTVRIQGTYSGGADTFLRVQRWEGGVWLDFPVPAKTDSSGHFTAYVELGRPGRYWLRVLDPDSGVTSKPFALVIRG